MSNTTLIVPGLHGSGRGHWQSWWQADHGDAVLVDQADWSNPDADAWLASLERAVLAHPGSIVVAHSLGSVLAARLARSHVAPLVAGALLVAPADIERTGELHGRNYEFGTLPKDRLPFPSIVVLSQDDPYMPFDKALALGRSWGSQVHDLGKVGHVNVASGFGRWEAGYELAGLLVAHTPGTRIPARPSISR
nr:alpha/beta hydrolase [uncultured Devosia sp.]